MSNRTITTEEQSAAEQMIEKAAIARKAVEGYSQEQLNKICQAVAWAVGNETTFADLAHMGVEESDLGDWNGRVGKRFKILGVLRDTLRFKSAGVVEEDEAKGLVKYAKPVGTIASVIPCTNPALTPAVTAVYALKARDAVIFCSHPRTKKTSYETVRVMREALKKVGAPEDLLQCVEQPSLALTGYLMSNCNLVLATGGGGMVKAAYSSGKPAFGVGAGNSTMVIDETAKVEEAALNSRLSKTSDFGSGCSADGNIIIEETVYDAFLNQLQKEGGYLATPEEIKKLESVLWDEEGHRISSTVACAPQKLAQQAGFPLADDRKFIICPQPVCGPENIWSGEKLTTVMAVYKYSGWKNALKMVEKIYQVGGTGHSCGIYSFDDSHINDLAELAPVSRMMVRQPQSKANAGSFTNGMPMTSSLGCGVWGGNITNENISIKHYLQYTWVSRPIPEDRPSDEELFGEFYNTEVSRVNI